MKKRINITITAGVVLIKFLLKEFSSFCLFFGSYLKKKIIFVSFDFEKKKDILVRFFLMKRGRYNRPFLHITAMVVLGIGVLVAPFLAETYPIFSSSTELSLNLVSYETTQQSITIDQDVFQTEISPKPRDEIITYTVEKGDTLSTIAKKFDISVETIKWANNLTSDDLSIGDTLKILPITGIAHKVSSGDTVYTIAKKYDANAQAIADFPFNDFANPETFSLVVGQILIVPDGIKPSEQPFIRRQVYLASGPVSVSALGFTWPLQGVISQFAAWYHMAIDITSPLGTPVVAGQSGTVIKALAGAWDGGYGTNIEIDGGNGYQSLYSHLSGLNVSVGDEIVAGRTVIGWVGLTGRTTGPHVHFEIRKNGVLVNPLPYLQ